MENPKIITLLRLHILHVSLPQQAKRERKVIVRRARICIANFMFLDSHASKTQT